MADRYIRIGHHKTADDFRRHLENLGLDLPCDDAILKAPDSPLAQPYTYKGLTIGNRFCVHPMEGWDGESDGNPTEKTLRRWRHFGRSGAKLIWGGEAVAVRHEGRANPNQLYAAEHTKAGLGRLHHRAPSRHDFRLLSAGYVL